MVSSSGLSMPQIPAKPFPIADAFTIPSAGREKRRRRFVDVCVCVLLEPLSPSARALANERGEALWRCTVAKALETNTSLQNLK